MRDYSSVRPRVFRRPELAQCGLAAGILYMQGWIRCDNFGRLDGSVKGLAQEVMSPYTTPGENKEPAVMTVEDVRTARDRLVAAGLWHLYQAGGQEYVEYVGYDDDQIKGWLVKRGAPDFPDDPNRPDLWAQDRIRYQGKARPAKEEPHGSADLPADPATGMPTPGAHADDAERSVATGMPTPGTEQGAAPAASPAAQAPDRVQNWAKWYNSKFGIFPSATELSGMGELQKTGVTDELIIECIQVAIKENARRPIGLARSMIADVVPYGVKTLADWVRHKAEQQRRSEPPPGDVSDDPPPEEEDEVARRLRQQRQISEVKVRAG